MLHAIVTGHNVVETVSDYFNRFVAKVNLEETAILVSGNAQILNGLRIIEFGTDIAAAYAAHLCAIYGADVITIEPPKGHSIRYLPPWVDGVENPDKSILFAYLGAGKRSVCLDLDAQEDVERAIQLILSADGVFDSYPPGNLLGYGVDLNDLANQQPQLAIVSISPFGQDGLRSNWSASSLILAAAGGQLYLTGDPDKPPLMSAGHQAYYQSGIQAFAGMLTCLYAAQISGLGDILELSIQEVQMAALEGGAPAAMWYGSEQVRTGNNPRALWGIYECADGWIGVAAMPRQTNSVLDVIGRADLKDDPVFKKGGWEQQPNELLAHLLPDFFKNYTAAEIFEKADRYRAPLAVIPNQREMLNWPHYIETNFWKEVHNSSLGSHPIPSGPIVFDDNDSGSFKGAPTIGEHTKEVFDQLTDSGVVKTVEISVNRCARLPLSGLRVVDMTQVWSGPYGARFLADMGAEVIKVEGPRFPDPIRTAGGAWTSPEINLSAYFNEYNRGKKSLVLDIKHPEGMAALKKLIRVADVFIENWSSGVADKNGLSYDDLKSMNPRIIYISMPGFGHEGPDATRVGFGPTIEQMGGLVALQGYQDGPPHKSGISYGDPIAGSNCAAAVAAALLRRQQTGYGMRCTIPQRNGITGLVGEFFIAEALGCQMIVREGFRHLKSAPHNIYPTIPDQEPRPILGPNQEPLSYASDRWIAIDCASDTEWAKLVEVIGDKRLFDEGLMKFGGRRQHIEFVDDVISEWTSNYDAERLACLLQGRDIAACPVMSPLLLIRDEHLITRDNFIPVDHDIAGTRLTIRPTWRLKNRKDLPKRSGPVFGSHNEEILSQLGYSRHDIASMIEQDVTGKMIISNS